LRKERKRTTVKTELKSYSSLVSKICSAALTEKKIAAAVKNVADREYMSKNVIIDGMREENGDDVEKRTEEIMSEIDGKPKVKDSCRFCIANPGKCRPTKFSLSNNDYVREILRKCRALRQKDGFKSVYICPDRCVVEQKAFDKLYLLNS
jgi:hypothetical protein